MPAEYLVKITPSAEQDFEDIFDFIAQDNLKKAEDFILEIENKISTLERFPQRCPFVPEKEFLNFPYRHLLHKNYRFIFFIEENIIYVLRILHGKRLWKKGD